ncbi:MAG: amidohydrolase, partial [Gammaproteobacteria bacterium]|nr:amidohydrolase [Gammaproteobacteria bacterium]
MAQRNDPDGIRLPIKIDSTSNGEFSPLPLTPTEQALRNEALDQATANAQRTGVSRRQFMVSLCGAASTLATLNYAQAAAGKPEFFNLAKDASLDSEAAAASLGKREFIFDVQGHYLRPGGHMEKKAGCAGASDLLSRDYMACIGTESFIKDVFLDSDTDMMVLSFVPSTRDAEPLTIEEADATRKIVEQMDGTHRLLIHGRVNPNQDGDIEDMERLAG